LEFRRDSEYFLALLRFLDCFMIIRVVKSSLENRMNWENLILILGFIITRFRITYLKPFSIILDHLISFAIENFVRSFIKA